MVFWKSSILQATFLRVAGNHYLVGKKSYFPTIIMAMILNCSHEILQILQMVANYSGRDSMNVTMHITLIKESMCFDPMSLPLRHHMP